MKGFWAVMVFALLEWKSAFFYPVFAAHAAFFMIFLSFGPTHSERMCQGLSIFDTFLFSNQLNVWATIGPHGYALVF